MRNKNIIIDFCMALNTPDILEMDSLVWQPIMSMYYVYLVSVGKKLEMIKM
jgi:hypothetical protein